VQLIEGALLALVGGVASDQLNRPAVNVVAIDLGGEAGVGAFEPCDNLCGVKSGSFDELYACERWRRAVGDRNRHGPHLTLVRPPERPGSNGPLIWGHL
jgi:hypothetical protein